MPYLSKSLYHSWLYRLGNEETIRIANLYWGRVLADLLEMIESQTHSFNHLPYSTALKVKVPEQITSTFQSILMTHALQACQCPLLL